MSPSPKPYRPGQGVFLGLAFGSFVGLLFDKLALRAPLARQPGRHGARPSHRSTA